MYNYGYQTCPGNLLFDPSLGVCNYPQHVDCDEFCAFDDVDDSSHRQLQEQKGPTGGTVRGKVKSSNRIDEKETVEFLKEKMLENERKLSVAEARLAAVGGQHD